MRVLPPSGFFRNLYLKAAFGLRTEWQDRVPWVETQGGTRAAEPHNRALTCFVRLEQNISRDKVNKGEHAVQWPNDTDP